METSKDLVIFFSTGGQTAREARYLSRVLGADVVELEPKEKYSRADLNWQDANSRTSRESQDENFRPELKELPDVSGYERIFIGFPIWWYTTPRLVQTFLENTDLSDKKIYPFSTSGGSSMEGPMKDLKKSIRDGILMPGKLLNENMDPEEIQEWIASKPLA